MTAWFHEVKANSTITYLLHKILLCIKYRSWESGNYTAREREGEKETWNGGLVLTPHHSYVVCSQSKESWDLFGKLTDIWVGFSHPSRSNNKKKGLEYAELARNIWICDSTMATTEKSLHYRFCWICLWTLLTYRINVHDLKIRCKWLWWVGWLL